MYVSISVVCPSVISLPYLSVVIVTCLPLTYYLLSIHPSSHHHLFILSSVSITCVIRLHLSVFLCHLCIALCLLWMCVCMRIKHLCIYACIYLVLFLFLPPVSHLSFIHASIHPFPMFWSSCFAAEGIAVFSGHLAMSGDIVIVTQAERGQLLACSGSTPRPPPPQCPGHPQHTGSSNPDCPSC